MKDPKNMTSTEKYNYIFENQYDYYVANRFGWFESLLSEIRTLIEDGQRLKNAPSAELGGNFGAGNVSIAILVCIGLELASALYSGTTKAKDGSYHAYENVKKFVKAYFPKYGVKIPLILWDGIRNDNAHLFTPKVIKVNNIFVEFAFFVKMSPYELSYVSKSNNIICIHINGIEFYHVFKKALQDYKTSVEGSDALQDNFINAWESIDNTPHELTTDKNKIPTEVRRLNSRLQFSEEVNIFSNPHNGLLLSSYYQDKSHEITKLIHLISLALYSTLEIKILTHQ